MRKVSREVGVRKRRWGPDGGGVRRGIKVRRQESWVGEDQGREGRRGPVPERNVVTRDRKLEARGAGEIAGRVRTGAL